MAPLPGSQTEADIIQALWEEKGSGASVGLLSAITLATKMVQAKIRQAGLLARWEKEKVEEYEACLYPGIVLLGRCGV